MPQNVTDQTLDHWVDVARSGGFKNSMNYFIGDGARLDFDINFAGGYIKQEDVKVYQVNPVTGARFDTAIVSINGNTVRVDRVTPVGRNLVIYRDTDKRSPLVDFSDNSIVNERNLDLNAKQAIFAVAEMVDRFDDSVTFAAEAAGAVEEAKAAQAKAEAAAAVATSAQNSSLAAAASSVAAGDAAQQAAQQAAADSVTAGAASATAVSSAQSAYVSRQGALASKNAAEAAQTAAAGSAVSAKADADRAKASADSIDPALLQQTIAAVKAGLRTLYGNFVGVPIPWGIAPLPTGYVKMNGAAFDKAANPLLAAMYPSGILPDLRGEFLRGVDDGRGVDAGRVNGSAQGFATQNHTHYLDELGAVTLNKAGTIGGTGSQSYTLVNAGGNYKGSKTSTINSLDGGVYGTETRPRNVAVLYICMTDAALPK